MQFVNLKSTTTLAVTLLLSAAAHAATVIPLTTVNGNAVASGPSFVVNGDFSSTETFNLDVFGTVDIATGENGVGYTTNAAGITTNPSNSVFNTFFSAGTVLLVGNNNIPYGALLIGNSTLGFTQVFPATAIYGLGGSTPPNVFSIQTTVGALFGTGLTNGTVLQFLTNDIGDGSDNSGSFFVSGVIGVPEPLTTTGLLLLGGVGFWQRKRRQQ